MACRVDHAWRSGPSGALLAELTAAAFRAEDEARSAYLDRLIKDGGTCRFCGSEVADSRLARSPGLCSRRGCKAAALAAAGLVEAPRVPAFVRSRPVRPPRAPAPEPRQAPREAFALALGARKRRQPFPEGVFGDRRPPRYRWVWDDGDVLAGWYTANAETWVRDGAVVAVTSHPPRVTPEARTILGRIARDLGVQVQVRPGASWSVAGGPLVEVRAAAG
jgi:hypothetical protein